MCIVGAGAAGLYASHYLNSLGITSQVVVEASSVVGGRLRQSTGNPSRPQTEIGAEIVHGDNSLLNRLINRLNIPVNSAFDLTQKDPAKHNTAFYYKGKLRDCRDPIWGKLEESLERMEEWIEGQPEDATVQDYLNAVYSDPEERQEMAQLIDAYMVKTEGTDLDIMSLKGICEEETTLDHNNYQYQNGYGYKVIVDHLAEHLVERRNLFKNFVVSKIEWDKNNNYFVINDGAIIADHVIVTASIAVLQQNMIEFVPALPKTKQVVINDYLAMRPGLKVILRFRQPFWKNSNIPHALVFVADHPIIAQFWFSHTYNADKIKEYVVTGFSTGNKAEYATQIGWSTKMMIDSFAELLFKVYDVKDSKDLLVDGFVYDWVKDNPFVLGSYSSVKFKPKDVMHINEPRTELAQPVSFEHAGKGEKKFGQLCIAGEAASSGANCANVQGALESGEQAVRFILPHLTPLTSKL